MMQYINGQLVDEEPDWYEDEECPECARRWKDASESVDGTMHFYCRDGHKWTKKPPEKRDG